MKNLKKYTLLEINARLCTFLIYILFLGSISASFIEDSILPLPDRHEIPNTIHQIWIGPNPLPEKFRKFIKSWKDKHPEWNYKLWTDEDLEAFPWTGINKHLYTLAWNYGMKSDILRYEILWHYGGIYADVDVECIKPFDCITEKLSFMAVYMPCKRFHKTKHPYDINTAILASSKHHPIIKNLFNHIAAHKHLFYIKDWQHAFICCGPYSLNFVLPEMNYIKGKEGLCILPVELTHPILPRDLRENKFKPYSDSKEFFINYPQAIAVHHHSGTWY